jgi:ribosomal protein S18 acetylase RimI-like enzyme
MTWTIRPIGADEAALLPPLLAQVHDLHVRAQPGQFRADPDPEEVLAFLQGWLSQEEATALVAFGPDGRALGYVIFEVETRAPSALNLPRRRGMLHHVAVDRAARRAGLGLALIEEVKARLRAQGVERLATIHGAFNAPSAALMRKAGLEPLNVIAEGPA